MSSISSIGNSFSSSYQSLSSGKRINSAADDAAGLAIVQKQEAQINGYDAGTNNMKSAQSLLNVSDSALGSITDYLQQIRELAVSASNGILGDDDRSSIQMQIDQLKQGINDVANNTTYNSKNILNGSNSEFDIATDGNGSSTTISASNALLSSLGIADFDVTKNFDIQSIDDALNKVSRDRSTAGAQSNALEHAINYNSQASYNTASAQSRIEDLDYPKAVSEQKKEELLNTYSVMMQKKQQENELKLFGIFLPKN